MSVHPQLDVDKDVVTFGRLPSCNVVLDSTRAPQMISRLHGRLVRRMEDGKPQWLIVDNKSLNGILVNGVPISEERPLQSGDVITFGRVMAPPEFEFVFEVTVPEKEALSATAVEELQQQMARIAELQRELDEEREQKRVEAQQRRQATKSSLDVAELHSELVCSICQDWLVHAANIECSHTFCAVCIDTWLLTKNFECPVCRQAVTREPVRSRALDTIVQKTVARLAPAQKQEWDEKLAGADKAAAKAKRLHAELEKSVNEALKKGKAFFHIDSSWSRRERDLFTRGVKDYTGETRETYCKLTGLTVQWVHSADENKLNQSLHNLGLQDFVSSSQERIRQRLLMFLRYG